MNVLIKNLRIMKQTLLTLALMLLPMLASADAVEIDGIYYNLDTEAKTAEVTNNPNSYSGSVAIPEKVKHEGTEFSITSIGEGAFYGCLGLTSITIPNSVTSIGEKAFSFCWGLTSIEVESGNMKYDSRDNCNAIIETESNMLIAGCKNTTIPNSVTSIGNNAFYWCSGLTSITIPNSVTSIGNSAFEACSSLTSIIIPNSVTSIGKSAFQECRGLTSITIPNSVTSIGGSAFQYCSGLLDMFCYAGNVPKTGSYAFEESNIANATLHVPAGSVGAYQAAKQWKNFKEIVELKYDEVMLAKFDHNNDGVVDAADIIVLVNYIAGKK